MSLEPSFKKVKEYPKVDEDIFQEILHTSEPAVLKGLHFGDCMSKWNLTYLREKLGQESIIIHESDNCDLDFMNRNFEYKKCQFNDFADKLEDENKASHIYLRSINQEFRSKRAARIEEDFQTISDDLKPPKFIPHREDSRYHSSVMRIASNDVQIWTHFDLYDNVLCQVVGTKRIILFPPEDIKYLYIEGDKSAVNCLDDWSKCLANYPLVSKTTPYRCSLQPGETLFIPSLWWHNIRTLNDSQQVAYSIGFNIFWRDEKINHDSIYADRDVYGNKNLAPYDAALANLDKAIKHLAKLPGKYNSFYKFMLLNSLRNKISKGDE